jgi:hypothetical protein
MSADWNPLLDCEDPFDPSVILRSRAQWSLAQAARRCATPDKLPTRPSLEWCRLQASRKLDELRRSNSAARQSDAQLVLAREFGYPSWPKLAHAISDRASRATSLSRAIEARDQAAVLQALNSDLAAVLDAGVRASPTDLGWVADLWTHSGAAEQSLYALHDVIVLRRRSSDLAECLEAMLGRTSDWDFAMQIVRERMNQAGAEGRSEEVDQLEDALGQLAWYDEPDFDGAMDGD